MCIKKCFLIFTGYLITNITQYNFKRQLSFLSQNTFNYFGYGPLNWPINCCIIQSYSIIHRKVKKFW